MLGSFEINHSVLTLMTTAHIGIVILPELLRPPDFFRGANKDFSGADAVTSSKAGATLNL
jgi:hypothetical protein